jgi:hypothetical protein
MPQLSSRNVVFLTHAAPEDNEFALWLASKLAMAGYRVWVDRRRLRGGNDTWDEIDRILRTEAVKQVVVFTRRITKEGVKKELAIGDIMKTRLSDPNFIIPIRNDDVAYEDAPPEFVRKNILNAYPNWHDCLRELFDALDKIPHTAAPDADILKSIVEAREEGRRFVLQNPEMVLTNWFQITPPTTVRYFRFESLQEQTRTWLADCNLPHVTMGLLAGTFADPAAFSLSSSFVMNIPVAYDIPFEEFVTGKALGPYRDKPDASKDVSNLLRQHFNDLARNRGLLPVEFANKEIGWFFPDNLLPSNRIVFDAPSGRRIRRGMSGKFKGLRWHVCILGKPRIWPVLCYRVHANVVLTEDGQTALPGDKTHKRRRRLTKSWWNDVWRDRLLAAMHHLADGGARISMGAGNERFSVDPWPIAIEVPVSYAATDPPLPSEEDEEGNIIPTAALDDQLDEFGDEGAPKEDDEP